MNHVVYFADKSVFFTTDATACKGALLALEEPCDISRSKVTKILENDKSLFVVSADPDATFARFAEDFAFVEAAGGVTVNRRGEWLMMRRYARWDLPKGHVEPGESFDECASREIEEETGVRGRVVRPLCDTLHAYLFPKTSRWELKRTHWFELEALDDAEMQPQEEEGIEEVEWCSPEKVREIECSCYPTVRTVLESMKR